MATDAEKLQESENARKYWRDRYEEARKKNRDLGWEIGDLKEEIRKLSRRNERLAKENEELKMKLAETGAERDRLKVVASKDSSNSSFPTSKDRPWRKPVANSREKSGMKPGGQPGHKGHARKVPEADMTREVELELDDATILAQGLKPTGEVVEKSVVGVRLLVEVTKYRAHVYISADGKKVHAPFPEGVGHNEMSYSPALKTFLYYLIAKANVSRRGAAEFISMLSGGKVKPSTGFVDGLMDEFASKATPELNEIFLALAQAPQMHVDFTNAAVDGKSKQVLVCCNADASLYLFRDHKGHKGVEGSPLEHFKGLVYHDHDTTFFSYGMTHQECLVHIKRYLKGVVDIEKDRPWAQKMLDLFNEFFALTDEDRRNMSRSDRLALEERYSLILNDALRDYEENPPSKVLGDGYRLASRMMRYKDDCLRFLQDPDIELENNLSERKLRQVRRKMNQMTTFRSMAGGAAYCAGLSLIETVKDRGSDVLSKMLEIFSRPELQKKESLSPPATC